MRLWLVSWEGEGAVTSSREDAILRLGNGSQGARQMERAEPEKEGEGEGGRMGEWERRDLKLEGTGGVGVGGLLSVCRDPPSNYSFPRGEGSGSNEQGERGRQRVQISCSIC